MIRARLLWGFVLIALVPLLGVGVGTSLISYFNGRQQSIDRLESVAARGRNWPSSLGRGLCSAKLQVASQTDYPPRFVSTALQLADDGTTYDWYDSLVRKRLQALVEQSPQFQEVFLLDLHGRVVVSTDVAREGKDYSDTLEFRRGLTGPFTRLPFPGGTSSIVGGQATVVTTVPVRSNTGAPLGLIGGCSGLNMLSAILDERTGLGATGRAYLVDADHRLLAGTRLPGAAAAGGGGQASAVSVSGLDGAIRSGGSNSGIYTGSAGAPVVGSSRWLPDLEVALSVEQDVSEALGAVFATIGINAAIELVAVAVAVVASILNGALHRRPHRRPGKRRISDCGRGPRPCGSGGGGRRDRRAGEGVQQHDRPAA